jgi:glucose/arabinose dehydrogenase
VIFVPFRAAARPAADRRAHRLPQRDDKALGRPVGVEIARDGALLVADDVGNDLARERGAGGAA